MRYRVLRPPYCYRWAVLLSALVLATTAAVALFSSAEGAPAAPAPVAAAAAQVTPAPATELPPPPAAGLVRSAAGQGRTVALTFDDGPDPVYTPQILDALTRAGAVATFCMIGTNAARHPELVRAVVDRGMRLCDHTISHDEQLPRRSEQRITAEIAGCWSDLQVAADRDVPVPYFRAPGGNWSELLTTVAARQGMKPLSWSVDSRDWTLPGTAQIVATVQRAVQPGTVVLLHDGGGKRAQTVEALNQLLPWFTAQGYRFDFPG
ncbi:Peptidoglycan/xylan/chitin deacetylase, PgdA/CDA1 family [Amycolatopsis sacchari]|uniref:Peptidoglycan/xylan/chitin deacetylase, PgdA/CDA1 family n=1 Tax=Amycolatopsis sacchari TaxID=115433 RepID=A0A1I3PUT7_9PSEU|nr:polysaccharide deacetylase family protein [Amycolatopsis sacchari]SFJ24981.1 Peptidoglycan/xylan/chitin deacetylase, PgdA/CDA1 family [Amycolatopsis sacchari]